jgi:hypothetical protein
MFTGVQVDMDWVAAPSTGFGLGFSLCLLPGRLCLELWTLAAAHAALATVAVTVALALATKPKKRFIRRASGSFHPERLISSGLGKYQIKSLVADKSVLYRVPQVVHVFLLATSMAGWN